MRIFLTGGSGFIGRYVVQELLSGGHTLLLLARQKEKVGSWLGTPGADILEGNLSGIENWRSEVERFSPDATVHLAWEGLPDYGVGTSVRNLKYGLDLLMMLAEVGCKTVIGTGSCWEYGQPSGKVTEDTVIKPHNAFTVAKNSLHWMGREIAREHGMNFIWTRLFYVYGLGQRDTSLIPYIIKNIRQGKKPEIKNPLAKNDFIFVTDVARAMAAVLKKPQKYGVYNIGSGAATGVQQILELICDKLGFSYRRGETGSPAGDPVADFWADISKINRDTGWKPETGIKEGIQKYIEYYERISTQ